MIIEGRYDRNLILQPGEQEMLAEKRALIVGAGGLGGYVSEMLARLGVGHLSICDYDTFSASNLNRQLMSTEENLGRSKAAETQKRIASINSQIEVATITDKENLAQIKSAVQAADIVLDCLDTGTDRLLLQEICSRAGKVLVHGAIGGWAGQVSTVYPGDDTLTLLYGKGSSTEKAYGNPSFTPAIVAGLQVSEAVKVLTGRGETLRKKLLTIDLKNNDFSVINLG